MVRTITVRDDIYKNLTELKKETSDFKISYSEIIGLLLHNLDPKKYYPQPETLNNKEGFK